MYRPRSFACITAVTAAALASAALVPAATSAGGASAAPPPSATSAASAAPRIAVTPEAIRLPGQPRRAPFTTAQCEETEAIACYSPDQIRAAYHLPALYAWGIDGAGHTIVVVDSFGSPTIRNDLATFDQRFGYPAPPEFQILTPAGQVPAFDPNNSNMTSWAGETTLDVEYAHALAPGASIVLVETPTSENEGTSGFPQIVQAEQYVIDHGLGDVISQSFSATESTFASYAEIQPLRAAYLDAASHHVTVLAASGDEGATDYTANGSDFYTRRVTSWPDSDPLVTGIGGTQLVESHGAYSSVAWNDTYNTASDEYWGGSTNPDPLASGGGTSEFFARPSYQDGVKAVTGASRGVPDISMSAACNGAVNVYSSFANGPAGWSLTCGTSEATPEFAAVVALADQVAGHPLGLLNPALYALLAQHAPGLVGVTGGDNSVSFNQGAAGQGTTSQGAPAGSQGAATLHTVSGYQAGQGYNLVTGVGTVNASEFVYELAGVPAP